MVPARSRAAADGSGTATKGLKFESPMGSTPPNRLRSPSMAENTPFGNGEVSLVVVLKLKVALEVFWK